MPNFFGTILQPRSAESCQVLRNTTVQAKEDGEKWPDFFGPNEGGRGWDEDCWIIPGFVDAHLHVPQWDVRGIDGLTLFQWQAKIGFPAESRLDDPATGGISGRAIYHGHDPARDNHGVRVRQPVCCRGGCHIRRFCPSWPAGDLWDDAK